VNAIANNPFKAKGKIILPSLKVKNAPINQPFIPAF
jgi:hypothetical protein